MFVRWLFDARGSLKNRENLGVYVYPILRDDELVAFRWEASTFAIGIASMAMSSSGGFEQWVYGIGRSRHGRHGKTDTRRGSSVRSEGIVLTTLLCSANGICAICSILTKNITTRFVRTYRRTVATASSSRSDLPGSPSCAVQTAAPLDAA